MLHSPLKFTLSFGRKYCFRLQGRREQQGSRWIYSCYLIRGGALLDLYLDFEDAGEMFSRNVA
jgi:hypothetical protein